MPEQNIQTYGEHLQSIEALSCPDNDSYFFERSKAEFVRLLRQRLKILNIDEDEQIPAELLAELNRNLENTRTMLNRHDARNRVKVAAGAYFKPVSSQRIRSLF